MELLSRDLPIDASTKADHGCNRIIDDFQPARLAARTIRAAPGRLARLVECRRPAAANHVWLVAVPVAARVIPGQAPGRRGMALVVVPHPDVAGERAAVPVDALSLVRAGRGALRADSVRDVDARRVDRANLAG